MTRPTARLAGVGAVALLAALSCATGCGEHDTEQETPGSEKQALSIATFDPQRPKTQPPLTLLEAADQPAPKPRGPLPEDASCVTAECHVGLVKQRHVHGPVGLGSCGVCHGEDTGTHAFPIQRDGDALCTYCHQVVGTREHTHEAVRTAGCATCHEPHGSQTDHLLTAISEQMLCQRCHDLPLKKFAHDPFVAGQCSACHQPHESANAHLLRGGEGPDHCRLCHESLVEAVAASETAHAPAAEGCVTCHSPHTSDQPHQLTEPVFDNCVSCHEQTRATIAAASQPHGALAAPGSCAVCHDPHVSSEHALMRERPDRVCLDCHAEPVTTETGRVIAAMAPVMERRFLHGPLRDGQCDGCHNAHAADHDNLLRERFPSRFYIGFDIEAYALCFRCHSRDLVLLEQTDVLTGFRDGDRNLHYVHVNRDDKGRTCKTCHNVHGSDLPNHMAASVPFEGSAWAMPIRYNKTEQGGSCAPGCHEPMQYRRSSAPQQTPSTPDEPLAEAAS